VGDYFGEMALLNDEPRKADVVASGQLECFVLERAKVRDCISIISTWRNIRDFSLY